MDDNFDDYFVDEQEEEKEQPHVETAAEREDREIRELTIERRHGKLRLIAAIVTLAVLVALILWLRARYFVPYSTSERKGWIVRMENEGALFKTYEGVMIDEACVSPNPGDTITVFCDMLDFTILDDDVARDAMRMNANGKRVVARCELYKGRLPWRGNSRMIVTKVQPDSDRVAPAP